MKCFRFKWCCILVVMMIGISGCSGNNKTDYAKRAYQETMTDEELYAAIVDNNNVEAMMAAGEYFTFTNSINNNDYLLEVSLTMGPNDYICAINSAGDEYILDNHMSYGYFAYSNGLKMVRLYDDELYEVAKSSVMVGDLNYEFNPNECIVERYEKDGILYVTAQEPCEEKQTQILSAVNFDVTRDISYFQHKMEFDPVTLRMMKVNAYAYSEGESIEYLFNTYSYSKDKPCKDIEQKLQNEIFASPTHTIKIIVGAGTEREKEYIATACEETFLDYWIYDIDQSYDLYSDPDYTEPVILENGYIPFDTDKVLYMK